MSRVLKCFFIIFSFCVQHNTIHAQTLNADTLAKYHVSKILTYTLDNTGQKVLQETRIINEQGLVGEYSKIKKSYSDSVLHSIFLDSIKYIYDLKNKITNESHTGGSVVYINGEKHLSSYSWNNKNFYKNPFFINPFSNKRISYIYYKNHCKIIKRYSKGKLYECLKFYKDHEYSFDVFSFKYKRYPESSSHVSSGLKKRLILSSFERVSKTQSTFNSNGDVLQKNIRTKTRFIKTLKPLLYSYIRTYQYAYEGPFILTCKTQQPDFNYRYVQRKRKMIHSIEETGTVIEEEFYEYIIDLPRQ